MKIACLGWGSLVWNPGDLPIVGEWHQDGPALPVEFTRQSKDGRMTLVITDGARSLTVLWCELKSKSLDEARDALRAREGVPIIKLATSIGLWSPATRPTDDIARAIADWAVAAKLDGVVWTALPPKFGDIKNTPSCDQVVTYLVGLEGKRRRLAEEYIRNAPAQIATAYRQRIESELGWTPTKSDCVSIDGSTVDVRYGAAAKSARRL